MPNKDRLSEEEFVRKTVISNIVGITKFWITLRDYPIEKMVYSGDQMVAEMLEKSGLREEIIRVIGLYDRASNTSTDLSVLQYRDSK
jgi:hypothetical protein